jgi:hypothetical protein
MLGGPSPARPPTPQGIASRVVAPQRIAAHRPRGGGAGDHVARGHGGDRRAAGGVVRPLGVGPARATSSRPGPAGRDPGRAAAAGSREARRPVPGTRRRAVPAQPVRPAAADRRRRGPGGRRRCGGRCRAAAPGPPGTGRGSKPGRGGTGGDATVPPAGPAGPPTSSTPRADPAAATRRPPGWLVALPGAPSPGRRPAVVAGPGADRSRPAPALAPPGRPLAGPGPFPRRPPPAPARRRAPLASQAGPRARPAPPTALPPAPRAPPADGPALGPVRLMPLRLGCKRSGSQGMFAAGPGGAASRAGPWRWFLT